MCDRFYIGREAIQRPNKEHIQTATTYVDKVNMFEGSGFVTAVELYVEETSDKSLMLGIYRGESCLLNLVQKVQIEGSRLHQGLNIVRYDGFVNDIYFTKNLIESYNVHQ